MCIISLSNLNVDKRYGANQLLIPTSLQGTDTAYIFSHLIQIIVMFYLIQVPKG